MNATSPRKNKANVHFTATEDDALLQHYAECNGVPAKLSQFVPGRSKDSISQHIRHCQKFKDKLSAKGHQTTSESSSETKNTTNTSNSENLKRIQQFQAEMPQAKKPKLDPSETQTAPDLKSLRLACLQKKQPNTNGSEIKKDIKIHVMQELKPFLVQSPGGLLIVLPQFATGTFVFHPLLEANSVNLAMAIRSPPFKFFDTIGTHLHDWVPPSNLEQELLSEPPAPFSYNVIVPLPDNYSVASAEQVSSGNYVGVFVPLKKQND